MPMTLRKPPGHRPSFCVSTLRVYSARPLYSASVSRPPLPTPWGIWRRSTSTTTPFFPISSRSPNQSPVRRGRSQKLPPQVGGISTGWAAAGPARTIKASVTKIADGTRRMADLFLLRGRGREGLEDLPASLRQFLLRERRQPARNEEDLLGRPEIRPRGGGAHPLEPG